MVDLMDILRWVNVLVSIYATFVTGKQFIRFYNQRKQLRANGRQETYLVLLSTFALFMAFNILNVIIYFISINWGQKGWFNTSALAAFRTLLVSTATIMLVYFYDKLED